MKRKYVLILLILVIVVAISISTCFLMFSQNDDKICSKCQMLNCHDHAHDNYCCDMCYMENSNKTCDCDMPNGTNMSNQFQS
ncbi:MAG: hypothetical protein LBT66_07815 [Methanobrevibacter sp.]|jgi:hypothetical protein|nr:hypothetical protein [Candidatus Methanovirga meridionalis]